MNAHATNTNDIAEKLIKLAKAKGADAADITIGESSDVSVSLRNGLLQEVMRSENSALGLRVFVGKKIATVSSSSFENLENLAERAVAMAKESTSDEYAGLAPQELLVQNVADLQVYDAAEPSETTLIEMSKEAEDAALSVAGITNSEGGDAGYSSYTSTLVTSNGFHKAHKSSRASISVCVLAGAGTDMQRDYDYSSTRFFADLESPVKLGKSAAERTLAKMNPRKIPSGKYTVVFDPRNAKGLLGDFAAGISGSSIARGTSYLKNKMGEQIFAKGISVFDDPLIIKGQASRPFDGEGVAAKKLEIIRDGVLQSWVLDVRSANQLKLVTNGRASRGVGSNPHPSTSNLYFSNGTISPQDIIADIKNGIYITDTFGMGINYTNGDYSQGASGFAIENGKLTYPVNEITIAGNLLDMFKDLTLANDLEFKYSTNSPTARIEQMTIAGS